MSATQQHSEEPFPYHRVEELKGLLKHEDIYNINNVHIYYTYEIVYLLHIGAFEKRSFLRYMFKLFRIKHYRAGVLYEMLIHCLYIFGPPKLPHANALRKIKSYVNYMTGKTDVVIICKD